MSMSLQNLKLLSHELRLFGIHESLERRSNEALATSQPPLEYLRLILEDERLFRRERSAKRLSTKARFRSLAMLEDWDHTYERGINRAQFKDLSTLGFYQDKENVLITGSTGTGKTHLAIALGKKLCSENIRVQFFSTNLFFEECQAEKVSGNYLKWLKKLKQTNVLILDDFGLRNYSHEEATILLDLLEERYRKGLVILTSQVEPSGWGKLFEDPVIAEAITDRLLNPSRIMVLKGSSYREKLKKPLRKETKESTRV